MVGVSVLVEGLGFRDQGLAEITLTPNPQPLAPKNFPAHDSARWCAAIIPLQN